MNNMDKELCLNDKKNNLIQQISQAFPDLGYKPSYNFFEEEDEECDKYGDYDYFYESKRAYRNKWREVPRAAMINYDGIIYRLKDDQFLYFFPAFMTEQVREDHQRLGMALDYILLGKSDGAIESRRDLLLKSFTDEQVKAVKSFLFYYSDLGFVSNAEVAKWPNL